MMTLQMYSSFWLARISRVSTTAFSSSFWLRRRLVIT